MKKKLALLLVLSMVLSMIPMNVFGRTSASVDANTTIGGTFSNNLLVDPADFNWAYDNGVTNPGTSTASVTFNLELGGALFANSTARNWADFWDAGLAAGQVATTVATTGTTGITGIIAAPTATYTYSLTTLNRTNAQITLTIIDDALTSAMVNGLAAGQYYISVPFWYYVTAQAVTGTVVSNAGVRNTFNIAAAPADTGIVASVGSRRDFYNYAVLDGITVSETNAYDFTARGAAVGAKYYRWFRLEAPNNYLWNYNSGWFNLGANDTGVSQPYGSVLNAIDTANANANERSRYYLSTDRKILYLRVGITNNRTVGSTWMNIPDRFTLTGLTLVADDRAVFNSDVQIRISRLGGISTTTGNSFGASTLGAEGADTVATITAANWWDFDYDWKTVARRVNNLVAFEIDPDGEATEIRSGLLPVYRWAGDVSQTGSNVSSNGHMRNLQNDNDTWTEWMVLHEVAPNAWSGTYGADVTFSVPEGVTINAAAIFMEDVNRTVIDDTYGVQPTSSTPTPEGVLVKPNYVRITSPLQNWTDRALQRELWIALNLSVEAGFEAKYPDVEGIAVTASGSAVNNLPEDERTIYPAVVYDPVELVAEKATTDVNNYAYNTNKTAIENIVINEREIHDLRKGDEIWVYVIGNKAFEVEFDCNRTATVNTAESGLSLSKGTLIRHSFSNTWYNGIKFTVDTESWKTVGGVGVPGVIELTDCVITGSVYPDIEYSVVVSGNAVAQNDYYVYEENTDYATARAISYLLFENPPYEEVVLELEENTITQAPPAAYEPEAVEETLVLNEYTASKYGVSNPYIMHQVNANTKVGMVSARVFGTFLGCEIEWDAASGVATITGARCDDGSEVVLVFKSGENTATINGEEVDIADYSKSAATGTVSIVNQNGATYLPLRFLANAFGTVVGWDAATSTATFYK